MMAEKNPAKTIALISFKKWPSSPAPKILGVLTGFK
jgi:hypothetical protein